MHKHPILSPVTLICSIYAENYMKNDLFRCGCNFVRVSKFLLIYNVYYSIVQMDYL